MAFDWRTFALIVGVIVVLIVLRKLFKLTISLIVIAMILLFYLRSRGLITWGFI